MADLVNETCKRMAYKIRHPSGGAPWDRNLSQDCKPQLAIGRKDIILMQLNRVT